MGLSLAIIIYTLLATEIIIIEIVKRRKGIFYFNFLTIANVFYLISYSITPIYYLNISNHSLILPDLDFSDYIAVITLASYQMLLLGWFMGGAFKQPKHMSYNNYIVESKWIKLASRFIFLTIMLLTLVVVGRGGINYYLAGALSRYSFEDIDTGPFAFLTRVTNIAPFITSIFFYFLIQQKSQFNKRNIRFFFWISLSVSLFQILGDASRGGMIRLFLSLGLIYIIVNKKIKIIPSIAIGFLGYLVIIYGKQSFYAISNFALNGTSFTESFNYLNDIRASTDQTSNTAFFLEFSHPFKSLDAAIRHEGSGYTYNYFNDFIWSFLRILPSRLTSIFFDRPEPIHVLNTSLQFGVKGSGGIPPGLIASFYYALGILGVVLGMAFYGFIGRRVNDWLHSMILYRSEVYSVPFCFFAYYFGFFIANGDPNIYIYYFIMPILFLSLIRFVRLNRAIAL